MSPFAALIRLVVHSEWLLVWMVWQSLWLIGLLVSWTCRAILAGVLAVWQSGDSLIAA